MYEPAPFVWGRLERVEEDGWNPQHCDDIALPGGWPDAKREAWPDLTDAATGGVLWEMAGQPRVMPEKGRIFVWSEGHVQDMHDGTTLAEACARALLAEWGGGRERRQMSDRSLSRLARKVARKTAGTALGCIIAGVVVWPLFPVGVALGVTAGVAGLVAEKLEGHGL